MNEKTVPFAERRFEGHAVTILSAPRYVGFRWVDGAHLIAIGATFLLLPQGQFGQWLYPTWLYGGLMALAGFGLLWLTVFTLPKSAVMALSLLITLLLLIVAVAYVQAGTPQGAGILVAFACGIVWTALTPRVLHADRVRPDVLGVVLGAASAAQGALLFLPGATRNFPTPLGIAPATTASVWLVTGLAVVVVQFIANVPSWLRWVAHVACGLAMLGFWAAVSALLSSVFSLAGLTLAIRGAGTIFVPWWSGRQQRFDAYSLHPRLALALFTTAAAPVLIVVPALVNSLEPQTPDLSDVRYAAFALTLAASLGAGAAGWWFAGQLTSPLRTLMRSIERIGRPPNGTYGLSQHPFGISELETLRVIIDDMARTIQAQTQANAELLRFEQQARREAEAANRLKLQFLAMISHELRTPLTSIKGFLSTLLAYDVTWTVEQQREFLGIAEEETGKLTELVDQLLNLTRLQAGSLPIRPEKTMLSRIVEGASPQIQTMVNGHQLRMDGIETAPPVMADAQRIGQVLVNLVGNAAKFSPGGSVIAISAQAAQQFVQVDVCDKGTGIPPDARLYVFDAFRQVDGLGSQHSKGAGLGLAICKGLVEAHGGRIWVQDRDGSGTTISFTLPAA